MSSGPVFTITYWGTTGTVAAPLRPAEVSAKLRDALLHLAKNGRLDQLAAVADDTARLDLFLRQNLPFSLRSTWGGNTTCVQIQTRDALIIIDCGSGIRELGTEIERHWNAAEFRGSREAHVLFTHAHMDHTLAAPFFDPFLDPRNHFTLYGSDSVMKGLDAIFSPTSALNGIYFPVTFELLKAIRNRVVIEGGSSFSIGVTNIATISLRHPGGCLGYRFDCSGKSFVFCTDHEQVAAPDPTLVKFAQNADLLYLDAQYLAAEYEGRTGIMNDAAMPRRGWGHTSIEGCVATAVAAGVRQLHAGHREPKRDDADIARVDAFLRQAVAEALKRLGRNQETCTACVPYEGMVVEL